MSNNNGGIRTGNLGNAGLIQELNKGKVNEQPKRFGKNGLEIAANAKMGSSGATKVSSKHLPDVELPEGSDRLVSTCVGQMSAVVHLDQDSGGLGDGQQKGSQEFDVTSDALIRLVEKNLSTFFAALERVSTTSMMATEGANSDDGERDRRLVDDRTASNQMRESKIDNPELCAQREEIAKKMLEKVHALFEGKSIDGYRASSEPGNAEEQRGELLAATACLINCGEGLLSGNSVDIGSKIKEMIARMRDTVKMNNTVAGNSSVPIQAFPKAAMGATAAGSSSSPVSE